MLSPVHSLYQKNRLTTVKLSVKSRKLFLFSQLTEYIESSIILEYNGNIKNVRNHIAKEVVLWNPRCLRFMLKTMIVSS